MAITISEEEYEYLQRCRATAEFMARHAVSLHTSFTADYGPRAGYIDFELQGHVDLDYVGQQNQGNPLDLTYLRPSPKCINEPKLIKGE